MFTPGMNCTQVHLQPGRDRPFRAAQSRAVSRSRAVFTPASFGSTPMNSGYKCGSSAPVWTQQSYLARLPANSGPVCLCESDPTSVHLILLLLFSNNRLLAYLVVLICLMTRFWFRIHFHSEGWRINPSAILRNENDVCIWHLKSINTLFSSRTSLSNCVFSWYICKRCRMQRPGQEQSM